MIYIITILAVFIVIYLIMIHARIRRLKVAMQLKIIEVRDENGNKYSFDTLKDLIDSNDLLMKIKRLQIKEGNIFNTET